MSKKRTIKIKEKFWEGNQLLTSYVLELNLNPAKNGKDEISNE